MPKVLVTGMSGTGKSAALRVLGERGYRVVDTDTDEWSEWVRLPDGSPDWVWRESVITRLLADHVHGTLFLAGCKTNQGKFYPRFDHMALLSAPADILLARISARSSNPYGKSPDEQALILRHLAEVEPLLRATATVEIDASAPLSEVVRQLESLALPDVAAEEGREFLRVAQRDAVTRGDLVRNYAAEALRDYPAHEVGGEEAVLGAQHEPRRYIRPRVEGTRIAAGCV